MTCLPLQLLLPYFSLSLRDTAVLTCHEEVMSSFSLRASSCPPLGAVRSLVPPALGKPSIWRCWTGFDQESGSFRLGKSCFSFITLLMLPPFSVDTLFVASSVSSSGPVFLLSSHHLAFWFTSHTPLSSCPVSFSRDYPVTLGEASLTPEFPAARTGGTPPCPRSCGSAPGLPLESGQGSRCTHNPSSETQRSSGGGARGGGN